MQNDLDEYLVKYNTQRTHQGRNMNGQAPYQAFVAGLKPANTEESQPDLVA